jgi:hypothetical protein
MYTDEPNERRISHYISSYYPPKELTAFMEGYQQSMYDNGAL